MGEANMRVAISILGNYDWLTKYDRKYVRLVADFYSDLEDKYIQLPLRKCTEQDWAEFYEPDEEAKEFLDLIEQNTQKDVKDSFQCIDWN